MADQKISVLPVSAAITDVDLIPIVQGGVTKSILWSVLRRTGIPGFFTYQGQNTAAYVAALVNQVVGDFWIITTGGTIGAIAFTTGDWAVWNGTIWMIVNNDQETKVTGPASAADSNVAVFDGTTGKLVKDGGITVATLTGPTKFSNLNLPEGIGVNYRLLVSVTSNNLTVALKTLAGADPSATDPVYITIGGAKRTITAALSVTANAVPATNWFNAGGSELATQEIDYFVYLGYNATDGITIGFSRIPYAMTYAQFNVTTTNERYCKISTITNAAATDNYVNIGRFAATLSFPTGYTWTVPTFTAQNLVHRPIYNTRWLLYSPVYVWTGTAPTGSNGHQPQYMINQNVMFVEVFESYGTQTGTVTAVTISTPMAALTFTNFIAAWGCISASTTPNLTLALYSTTIRLSCVSVAATSISGGVNIPI